jgi:hypothetical protein
MNRAKAFAATSATSPFASIMIPRRDLTERDVAIEICSVASAAPTCTWCAMSGVMPCRRYIPLFRATKSSAV